MPRIPCRSQTVLSVALLATTALLLSGCPSSHADDEPKIEVSRIPAAGEGSPGSMEVIEGRVTGALPGQRIVLFAKSGLWWVQPWANQPYTTIQPDTTWKSPTHPGSSYAALLVDSRYRPPMTASVLPEKGGSVLAVVTVEGARRPEPATATLQFSGYQWVVRQTTGDPGGTPNFYSPANAWTDAKGFLHLRIARRGEGWVSAEVTLSWSLGYGSYRFVVSDISHLEPGAVLALGPPHEMDIQISRWGEPDDKNLQYVIQPYLVPANTVRFDAPEGTLTHWMAWAPGRVLFTTVRGSSSSVGTATVGEHVFTSGVPSPGSERVHMNFYVYDNKRNPLQKPSEVIIEKFEFRP
jgi:hypothetical protein